MDDSLFAEDRSIERQSLTPGQGFFVPEETREREAEAAVREAVTDARVVVVADGDADGLACVAMVRAAHGEGALVATGPGDLGTDLERVVEYGDPELLVVCDLCPDALEAVREPLATLAADRDTTVRWFDHHQWEATVASGVRDLGVDLVVGASEEECTADVALRALEYDFPDRFAELAAVTRDHDLWIKEDERSDDLADYAYWAEDAEAYVETVREHGVDLPATVREYLAERRVRKRALIDRAVDRADLREIGPWTVGVTYGRCSQNEVAERLRTEAGADAAVIVKPAGSASIRGSECFERCHEVARQVRGGGHPRAAGCKPDVYDDVLDYARHWVTQGEVAKRAILAGFEALVPADGAGEATGEEDESEGEGEDGAATEEGETTDDEPPAADAG